MSIHTNAPSSSGILHQPIVDVCTREANVVILVVVLVVGMVVAVMGARVVVVVVVEVLMVMMNSAMVVIIIMMDTGYLWVFPQTAALRPLVRTPRG